LLYKGEKNIDYLQLF